MENLTIEQKLELKKLRDLDLTKIEIEYNGGGDDGCIDEYNAYKLDHLRKEIYCGDIDLTSFINAFDEYIYHLLSTTIEWDWVNNEGGYGMLQIDLEKNSISLYHNQRYTEQHNYHGDTNENLEELTKNIKDGSSIIA